MDKIIIKGAREHNLKNISLEIPRDELVVITGVSGSGKSSLAFDTIYAEGQRRYVESLSAYARQFLERMDKPDVDLIEGLSPAISIEQKTTSKNPRSTVGTVTEIYDYLRLLFARVGTPYCYKCSKEIKSQTVRQMTDTVMALNLGAKVIVMAPIVRNKKGEYRKEFETLQRDGYTRVRVNNEYRMLEEGIDLDKRKKHNIDVVVDRLILKEGIKTRLTEAFEASLKLAKGMVMVLVVKEKGKDEEMFFNESLSCVDCNVSYPELTPASFSFNSPHGACIECNGIGDKLFFDEDLVVPDKDLSLEEGAMKPWSKNLRKTKGYYFQLLKCLAKHYKFSLDTPYKKLTKAQRLIILNGTGEEEIKFTYKKEGSRHTFTQPFEGVLKNLERRYLDTESNEVRDDLSLYMNAQPCPSCHGARLREEALFIKINKKNIFNIVEMPVKDCLKFIKEVKLSLIKMTIAEKVLKEIRERLEFLIGVGLDYLTLNRKAGTLSGGEGQRIRLATQIGSSLTGVLYVLDEPSIGLHQRDNEKLLHALEDLRDMGNTVLVVEHDEETILRADHVIDMGPRAGEHGGEIVAEGTPQDILKNKNSLTGKYLNGEIKIEAGQARKIKKTHSLVLKGVKEHNLKNLNVRFPLGILTCVTGVSGSGKSTLIIDTLYKQLAQKLYRSKAHAGELNSITGLEKIDKVIDIDQSPIGKTPRSNPATYTGLFTHIRELFAMTEESKIRGYGPGRFSFNVKGGRCESCAGDGMIKVEMHFLPDVYVQCDECEGKRYNRETLDVRYKHKNINDVLSMTVEDSLEFFKNIPNIKNKLKTLNDVGLGYIRLGQSATTLSGGEAQRIKLSRELSKRATGKTLYILDEPTTGLHFDDVKKLIDVLQSLVDTGNSVIVIEHNLDVIKSADHIIDLGPEGGEGGGRIIFEGQVKDIVKCKESYTGQFLKKVMPA